jgi:hypothetical protein
VTDKELCDYIVFKDIYFNFRLPCRRCLAVDMETAMTEIEVNKTNSDKHLSLNETNWEAVVSKKRQHPSDRDPRTSKNKRQDLNDRSINTSNFFTPLSNMNEDQEQNANEKVPPIYLRGIQDSNVLIKTLNTIGGQNSFMLKNNSETVIIFPKTPSAYRSFINFFEEKHADFHTYQLASEKLPKIVIRGLHHSTDPKEIEEALQHHGYNAVKITNILSRRILTINDKNQEEIVRKPLPLFFADISADTFNEKIFDLKSLLCYRITIEEPNKKKNIPQCTRCQAFSHTRTYCRHPFRCVRCGESHDSKLCMKTRDVPAKCANCNGSHPANYLGCTAYQSLRNQRQKKSQASAPSQSTPLTYNHTEFPSLPTIQRRTGEMKAAGNPTQHPTISTPRHLNRNDDNNSGQGAQLPQWLPSNATNQSPTDMVNLITNLNKLIQPLFTLISQLTQLMQSFTHSYAH